MTSTDKYLPLSAAVFHILLALADEARHGYAVMREVEERTGGLVRIGPGMLYGSVKWLLADGLIEAAPKTPGPGEDERRRYYRLTPAGLELLPDRVQSFRRRNTGVHTRIP